MTREEAISRIQRALNVPNRLRGLVLIDEESANMAIEALTVKDCHGCRHYDLLQTPVICHNCTRAYKDRYTDM